jgi:ATP-dependent Lon protease
MRLFMSNTPQTLPVLPLRDIVVFPYMIVPLFAGREKSIKALEQVMDGEKTILLLTQRDPSTDDPEAKDLFDVGCVAKVLQLLKLPDGTLKVLVEGGERVSVEHVRLEGEFLQAEAVPLPGDAEDGPEVRALMRAVAENFENYVKLNKKIAPDVVASISELKEPGRLADSIAAHLAVKIAEKQKLLETPGVSERLELAFAAMEGEISVLQVEKKIRRRVKRQMEKSQREYYLNEQMKAIQRELGDGDESRDEMDELAEKVKKTKLSKEARTKAEAEMKKLRQMSPMSAESTVVRNYLEWMTSIPWGKKRRAKIELSKAETILDEDHYGLEKVKERILEHLAVQARTKKIRGPILCLVGPPGVGKTSLGKSIARATGRNFVRVSLGGVRDEAEIRGHRRTYIGSMPGRIIQSMKKAKSNNPLFLLDEIDKLGADFRGDPAAALLEVLDPEQNSTFNDHYLEVDYDLSNVMFITTANSLNMPRPLMDRMEIIRIPGYTEDEKVEIATRHLIPKQMQNHALKDGEFSIEEDALRDLIRYYTREAGVRNLERELANLARKAVRDLESGKAETICITSEKLGDYAGVRKCSFGETDKEDQIGVVTGLAWTETGGDLLTIEAVKMPGRGRMTVTGNLRDVMKESISAANSYVHSRAASFGIKANEFRKSDIHVHVPEGATPKDGPSAGVAMALTIVSVLTGIPVRKDIAMTGEITLRGRVLEIGGLKEKLLAALRGGVKTVLIPADNAKDLAEVPDNVKNQMEIIPVHTVAEVLDKALTQPLTPVEWDKEEELALGSSKGDDNDSDALSTH